MQEREKDNEEGQKKEEMKGKSRKAIKTVGRGK